ncbi:Phage tail tube protein [Yersinia ruckeri]|uniref:Phage tail tube protein n=1 Tax=Yersinia ruckeri TaxID=29486 RepID=A0A380QTN4_YERRU|nr:Phage tail tube protein [Yersinia ruckeri]
MGDTRNRLAGTAFVTVDGLTIMVAGQFKYSPSRVKRETLTGMDGVHGYKETFSAPLFPARSAIVAEPQSVILTNRPTSASSVKLANGKTIIGSGMWSVNTQEVDSTETTAIFAGKAARSRRINMSELERTKTITLG